MSNQPLMEVELYAFASSSVQFYLTPHEFDVNLDGNLYSSVSIERNELALGAEAAKSAQESGDKAESDGSDAASQ